MIARLLSLCLLFTLVRTSFCQMAVLDKAQELIGKQEFSKAWNALEIASKMPVTSNEPRMFYLKAYLAKELFLKADGFTRDSLRQETLLLVEQCINSDNENKYSRKCKQITDFTLASIFNDGTDKFNANDFNQALLFFSTFLKQKESRDEHWKNATYYSAIAYAQTGKIDESINLLESLRQLAFDQPLLYLDLANLYDKSDKIEKAMVILDEGLSRYPGNYDMEIAELNTLSRLQRIDTLERKIEKFLSKYADNIEVLLMAGTVYQKKQKASPNDTLYSQKAESTYKSVLKFDPENFDGNYNLGALYYNRAIDLINKQDYDIDISDLTLVLERSMQWFKEALPYMLKIREVRVDDVHVLKALQAIYYNLNMRTELDEVSSRLEGAAK